MQLQTRGLPIVDMLARMSLLIGEFVVMLPAVDAQLATGVLVGATPEVRVSWLPDGTALVPDVNSTVY